MQIIHNQTQTSIRFDKKIIRFLHLIMIFLCGIATVSLFVIQSQYYKIMLSILVCSYGIFMMANSHIFKLVFHINDQIDQFVGDKRIPWRFEAQKKYKSEDEQKCKESSSREKIMDQTFRSQRQETHTAQRSMNMSRKNLSTSQLNESRLSQNHSREKQQKGFDLMSLTQRFLRRQPNNLSKSSFISQEKSKGGIILLQRKQISRKYIEKHKIENDNLYEDQLKNQIKKSKRQVQSRYKIILNHIHYLINPLINEHKSINSRIKQLSLDFLDITLTNEDSNDFDLSLTETMYRKPIKEGLTESISFQILVYKLFKLHLRKSTPSQINLPLKKHRSWNDFLNKIQQLLNKRVKLGETLGVEYLFVDSRHIEILQKFMMQYNYYINLLNIYVESDLNPNKVFDNQIDDFAEEYITQLYKGRIYVIYLFTKNLNENLKSASQIQLKDYLHFKHPKYTRVQFQIFPKYAYDSLIPYFNLFKVQDEKRTKIYYCEYGQANYLSIIYFLMHCLSQKSQLLSWNQYINKMVRDIL